MDSGKKRWLIGRLSVSQTRDRQTRFFLLQPSRTELSQTIASNKVLRRNVREMESINVLESVAEVRIHIRGSLLTDRLGHTITDSHLAPGGRRCGQSCIYNLETADLGLSDSENETDAFDSSMFTPPSLQGRDLRDGPHLRMEAFQRAWRKTYRRLKVDLLLPNT